MAELKLESSAIAFSTADVSAPPAVEKKERVIDTVQQVKQQEQDNNKDKQTGLDKQSVSEVVEEMNQSDAIRSTSLQFVLEEKGEPPVVQVMDKDTGEMIRQIPSELVVKLAKALDELVDNQSERTGFLFDQEI